MNNSSKLIIDNITVSPGSGTNDTVISTTRGFFVAKVTFESDTKPDLEQLKFKLKTFTIGGVDKLSTIEILQLGTFKSIQDGAKYKQTGCCSIKIDENIGMPIAFDKELAFDFSLSVDGGANWDDKIGCKVAVVNNSGVDVKNCVPENIDGNTAIDFNPIDDTTLPADTNEPVKIQFKALDSASNYIPYAHVNIMMGKEAITGVLNDRKIRIFQMNTDGSVGDELFFEKRNNYMIRTTVSTDAVGIATIACYATQNLAESDDVYSFRLGLLLSSNMEVYAERDAVFLTSLDFTPIEELVEIEGQDGNSVYYNSENTGLNIRFPEYQDWTGSDTILVVNKGYNAAENTSKVCASTVVNGGKIFYNYITEVSYLDVIPNSWNEMRFIIIQRDNVKISDPNLWDFHSPDLIDVDPPTVQSTEPVPDLIFTSEDGQHVHKIGKDFDYSLNSTCINYGGKLELTVTFDPQHAHEKDVVTVSYGIKAFKEGLGKREPKNAKATLTDDQAWVLTAGDVAAGNKTIQIPQAPFIGFDEDEHGTLGSMWLMANIGLSLHSELLLADIDTVGPGE